MILINLAEWIINFLLFGVSLVFIAIGMFLMTVIFYAVLDRRIK
jgi:hypothetical protein